MLATVALIATAATVISCNKHLPDPALPQGTAIQFTTEDNWTKAIADESTLESEGFRVWGWFKGTTEGHIFYTNKTDDGTHVTYSNGEWTYDPENPRYWMNGTYDFFAIYPQDLNNNVTYDDGDFKVAYNVASQEDLLVAKPPIIDGVNPPIEDGVVLGFAHALCQLEFQAKAKPIDVGSDEGGEDNVDENVYMAILTGIDIVNAAKSATYSSKSVSWTGFEYPAEGQTTFSIVKESENLAKLEEGKTIVYETGIMMLPQKSRTGSDKITLRVSYKGGVRDAVLDITEWLPGKKYTYILVIDQNANITFETPIVTDWVKTSGGNFVIDTNK